MAFTHILSPIHCGPFVLKNRMVMAPVTTGLEYAKDSKPLAEFYARIAADGVSMITIPGGVVHRQAVSTFFPHRFKGRKILQRHRDIVEAIHSKDCKTVLQLTHAGVDADCHNPISSVSKRSLITGKTASGATSFKLNRVPRYYADTARNAMECGYDGVEIDASGESLLADFLSPAVNKRTDAWGATELSRFKLTLDVLTAVRKVLGPEKVIGLRFNLAELSPNGASWDEILRLIQVLHVSSVDYFCCSFGTNQEKIPTFTTNTPRGAWFDFYKTLAENTPVPVMFGQHLDHLTELDSIAENYDNAIFEIAHPLIADPDFVHKISTGLEGIITPCMHCYPCCTCAVKAGKIQPIRCLVNPLLFKSYDEHCAPTKIRKKILVVGAGLAGITVASHAAKRGHSVILVEESNELGGQLRMAAMIPGKEGISTWADTLKNSLIENDVFVVKKQKITTDIIKNLNDIEQVANIISAEKSLKAATDTVEKNQKPQSDPVKKMNDDDDDEIEIGVSELEKKELTLPEALKRVDGIDHIVIATGSSPTIPDIIGVDSSNVVTYEELLSQKVPVGNKVAVIGTDEIALNVCRFLVNNTKEPKMAAREWREAWGVGDIKEYPAGVLGFIPQMSKPTRQVYSFEENAFTTKSSMLVPYIRFISKWLRMRGVQYFRSINIESIDNYSVKISYGKKHEDQLSVPINHVVLCCGSQPNKELLRPIMSMGIKVSCIGASARFSGFVSFSEIQEEAMALAERL